MNIDFEEKEEFEIREFKKLFMYDFCFDFVKNKNLLKKTNKGVKFSLKNLSQKRNMNYDLNNLLINSWVKKGLKLKFLKNYNIFLEKFLFLIIYNFEFFKDYPNFSFVSDVIFLKNSKIKFEYFLEEPLKNLEFMFDLKVKKLSKKLIKKLKKKHTYVVNYLHKKKRLKYALNSIYMSSYNYNEKKYYDRIFSTFLNVIFDTKNSPA